MKRKIATQKVCLCIPQVPAQRELDGADLLALIGRIELVLGRAPEASFRDISTLLLITQFGRYAGLLAINELLGSTGRVLRFNRKPAA